MEVQGIPLPKIQEIQRITNNRLGLQPTPLRGVRYTRQLSTDGDTWEIAGLIDHATLDELFGVATLGTVWITDPDRGNFHAIIEVEAAWRTEDAPHLEV